MHSRQEGGFWQVLASYPSVSACMPCIQAVSGYIRASMHAWSTSERDRSLTLQLCCEAGSPALVCTANAKLYPARVLAGAKPVRVSRGSEPVRAKR
eukprot:scaffold175789_cov19-Tisochrysis_lutea.AAC.3